MPISSSHIDTQDVDTHFDVVLPFQLEKSEIRGRLVRLNEAMKTIIHQHNYPKIVNQYMAQATALSLAIVNCFKFQGLFTLQINGDGPLHLLVVNTDSEGNLRACARFDEARLNALTREDQGRLHLVFGTAHMAFTLEPETSPERYQGIVELMGSSLAESTNHFFRQSEQLETGIVVVNGQDSEELASAALMIQRLPLAKNISPEHQEHLDDRWIHALSLTGSITKKELLDPTLSNRDLLYRLFWEEGVRVHPSKSYRAQCRCSAPKIKDMLSTFSEEDRRDMLQDDLISVTCEFCGQTYTFSEADFDIQSD
jgi:molecular chaperone Hsp33